MTRNEIIQEIARLETLLRSTGGWGSILNDQHTADLRQKIAELKSLLTQAVDTDEDVQQSDVQERRRGGFKR